MKERTIRPCKISGVATYFPPKILDNAMLEKMVDTNNEWILERTGIKTRHIAAADVATSHLGTEAAKKLLAQTKTDPKEIDLIVVTTVTPDMFFPATSCLIQQRIGATNAGGFDLNAACSGFLFGLSTCSQMIESGRHKKILLIGADKMSAITDYTDRNTCVLFGDAAGAVLLEPCAPGEEEFAILDQIMRIDGKGLEFLSMPGGGSLNPSSHETVDKKMHYIHQEGKQVFKFAVPGMSNVCVEILERNKIPFSAVDLLMPHQANNRIIEAIGRRLELPPEKVVVNIDRYGNTTDATLPSCLDDCVKDGRLTKGKLVLLTSFGAGFTWGAVLLRWAY
jgi:3-oxoacyl-[acyl-carrier-protein] synthase III